MAELDRLDRAYGLGTLPHAAPSAPRRARRQTGPVMPALLVTAVLLAGMVTLSPGDNMRPVRRLLGFDDERLGAVPDVPRGIGSHGFMQTQPGSDEPVGYDPCREIEVAVNPEGAPANAEMLVTTGLAHVSAATGLKFVRVGETDARDVLSSGSARRRPVLIRWATEEEVPELAGRVAGIGGSLAAERDGRLRYVTGQVILDRDVYASFGAADLPHAQAIVDHELAHLVGLDHVADPDELMNAENLGRTTFGPGDREGLARLGSIPC